MLAITDAADGLQAVTRALQLIAVAEKVRLFTAKYCLKAFHVCSKINTFLSVCSGKEIPEIIRKFTKMTPDARR